MKRPPRDCVPLASSLRVPRSPMSIGRGRTLPGSAPDAPLSGHAFGTPTRGSSLRGATVFQGDVAGALDGHSSFCSMRIAPTRRVMATSLGDADASTRETSRERPSVERARSCLAGLGAQLVSAMRRYRSSRLPAPLSCPAIPGPLSALVTTTDQVIRPRA